MRIKSIYAQISPYTCKRPFNSLGTVMLLFDIEPVRLLLCSSSWTDLITKQLKVTFLWRSVVQFVPSSLSEIYFLSRKVPSKKLFKEIFDQPRNRFFPVLQCLECLRSRVSLCLLVATFWVFNKNQSQRSRWFCF